MQLWAVRWIIGIPQIMCQEPWMVDRKKTEDRWIVWETENFIYKQHMTQFFSGFFWPQVDVCKLSFKLFIYRRKTLLNRKKTVLRRVKNTRHLIWVKIRTQWNVFLHLKFFWCLNRWYLWICKLLKLMI